MEDREQYMKELKIQTEAGDALQPIQTSPPTNDTTNANHTDKPNNNTTIDDTSNTNKTNNIPTYKDNAREVDDQISPPKDKSSM